MSVRERLETDMKDAMRTRDALRLETIRGARGAIRNKEIEVGSELDEEGGGPWGGVDSERACSLTLRRAPDTCCFNSRSESPTGKFLPHSSWSCQQNRQRSRDRALGREGFMQQGTRALGQKDEFLGINIPKKGKKWTWSVKFSTRREDKGKEPFLINCV